jgi:hypothetical protein
MPQLDNFQNVTLRCCSYCGIAGHNVRRCMDAYYDGMQIHNQILNVIGQHLVAPQLMDNAVKMFIQSLTLTKLKILSYTHTDLHLFAQQLYTNFQIPLSYQSLSCKRGLIVILGLYYENIYTAYLNGLYRTRPIYVQKFDIELQLCEQPVNSLPFLCPICLDDINSSQCLQLNCNHEVCSNCFDKYLSSVDIQKEPCCSLCRIQTTTVTFQDQDCYDTIKNKHFPV